MYIGKKQYQGAYNGIVSSARKAISLRQANASAATVLILCAPDLDALCAARILVALLNTDCIGYRVLPVSGWTELSRINQEMVEDNTDLRSIVLINLGSIVDLSEFFSLPQEDCTLHVIDSHRPWNLNNVFATGPEAEQIIVWDDGDVEADLGDEKTAYEALQYEPESDSDQDSDDDSDEEGGNRRRRRVADSDDEDSENEGRKKGKRRRRVDEDGNEIEDDDEEEADQPKRLSRKERKQHKSKLDKYHRAGTFYGQSVAGQMYVLATALQRTDNDALWLAILGLTYQFTSNLIDRERYDAYVKLLANEVARLNIHGQDLHQAGGATTTFISGPTDRSIRPSEELRFMLFRHWNLYDSMFHSGYVAGKLRLWREKGRKNLVGLLAKMGFSLIQCQQTYAHMDMKLKRALRDKVESICPEYGLDELVYGSFVRAAGYQSILSAADAVEAVGALLEAGHGVRLDFGKEDGFKTWNAYVHGEEDKENAGPVSKTANQHAQAEKIQEEEDESKPRKEDAWWVQNFWSAWTALGSDCTGLRSSLQLSMALHRSVIRQGTSILDKQAIKTLKSFRLAVIREGPDLAVFAHPATLSRLACWLVDAVRDVIDKEKTGRKKSLPFVVACLDERKDSFTVVGINVAEQFGDVRKNRFGLAFQQAAQLSGTRTVLDAFETCVLQVQKDDLTEFVERLHMIMSV